MFTKTLIALCAAVLLTTAYTSAASAQNAPQSQSVKPYTDFEKLWFQIPQGED